MGAIFGSLAAGVSFGVSLPASNDIRGVQFFAKVSGQGTAGVGAYVGAGLSAGYSRESGPLGGWFTPQWSFVGTVQEALVVGLGASVEVSPTSTGLDVGLPIPRLGVGGGAYAGAGVKGDLVFSTPQIGCVSDY